MALESHETQREPQLRAKGTSLPDTQPLKGQYREQNFGRGMNGPLQSCFCICKMGQ